MASLQSHQSVIQALSRKGIYVMEGDDTPVSDSDLTCQPIKMVRQCCVQNILCNFVSLDMFGTLLVLFLHICIYGIYI